MVRIAFVSAMEPLININGNVYFGSIVVLGIAFTISLGYHLAKSYDVNPIAGAVSGLPLDSAVEAACRITADGPKPLATGELKLPIRGYVQMMKAFEQLTIEAAVKGDRDLSVTALNMNPLCPSDELANVVIDELLEAHREYLPNFFR